MGYRILKMAALRCHRFSLNNEHKLLGNDLQ